MHGAQAEARRQLITDGYQALQAQFHQEREDYGISGHKYAELIQAVMETVGAESLLDYGAGKETLREALPQYVVNSYDPAIEWLAQDPEPHDVIACTDVMEHIEPDLTENVLDHIRGLSRKVVFFQIACRPAGKSLPDGRNAHINRKTPWEWLQLLAARWRVDNYQNFNDGAMIAVCSVPQEDQA
ncbi:MAG: hypothetical protein R3311_13940 [Oceanisphaera sp.]|nr:hypothetical protein [Oceanisphaera sp.]